MTLAHKTLRLTKTPTDSQRLGWFQGLASTYDVDWDRERFAPGAWTESLLAWQKAGAMPPVFFNHRRDEPGDIVGRVLSMRETADGLLIEGRLDLSNPVALAVYERMLGGVLDTMSVGFSYGPKYVDGDGVTVISRADLVEVSLTPIPANPRAVVQAVKSAAVDPILASYRAKIAALLPEQQPWQKLSGHEQIKALNAEFDRILSGEKTYPMDEARVERFVAQVREERRAEAEAEKQKRERQAARDRSARIRAFQEPGDEERREAERAEREEAERQRRAAEREAERLQSEQVAEARRAYALENPNIRQF